MTAQLLAFGRKAIIEPKILDLNRVVETAARLLSRLIGEDICLVTELDNELRKVTIDPVQLEQNADEPGCQRARCYAARWRTDHRTKNVQLPDAQLAHTQDCLPGSYVQLSIADNGLGMSDEVQRHLFEPFYTTKGVGRGTGLGLATVYGIVHQAAE